VKKNESDFKKMKSFVLGVWLSSRSLSHYASGPGFNHKDIKMKTSFIRTSILIDGTLNSL
jgi:hypothetical protein